MGSVSKSHVVCVPMPVQGHINPMLNLARILHQRGLHVTFVHTQENYDRLIRSRGAQTVAGFQFEAISDCRAVADADPDARRDVASLCSSVAKKFSEPLRRLLSRLNSDDASFPVSCVVSDISFSSFSIDAAEELGVPIVLFWTASACGLMGRLQVPRLIQEGLTPLKDESYLTSGHLDTVIDWIPGMEEIRLRDLVTSVRTTDPNDFMLSFPATYLASASRASAVIINTFDALEHLVLEPLVSSSVFRRLLSVGPLHLALERRGGSSLPTVGSNLWREESECLLWLDGKEKDSVLYVNFGTSVVLSPEKLHEFAWGLVESGKLFVWVMRPGLVVGDCPANVLPDFGGKGIVAGWCDQEKVLSHSAVGGFLTHCGWNSTLESLIAGVPMACWPFFGEQPTNCRFLCREWGVGIEISEDVKREEIVRAVRELLDGEKGKEMRIKALEWKEKALKATSPGGSSFANLDYLVNDILLKGKPNNAHVGPM